MTIQATAKRKPQLNTGIKLLIMAASVVTTIGGWGILAVNQTQDAIAATQQTQATTQTVNSTLTQNNARTNTTVNNSSALRQVNPSTIAPRAQARTRSSR